MGFASEYLEHRVLYKPFIGTDAHDDTRIIVIIPAFDEPDIVRVLESLARCKQPPCNVEVIIHLNAGNKASKEQVQRTLESHHNIESWKKENNPFYRLFCINTGQHSHKKWGAGMARKVVMDEALYRFNSVNRPDGVIVSLDADCTVSDSYLVSLYKELYLDQSRNACTIKFEHPLSGEGISNEISEAVIKYELHLRYYYQALLYTGYPHVYHTIGSAMAVKASAYSRAGGMVKNQAGEDFYFIQKLLPMGGLFNLASACVYPSPRISERVPFGTGPVIRSLVNDGEPDFYTYNPDAFTGLRKLFSLTDSFHNFSLEDISLIKDIPTESLGLFLDDNDWINKLAEIKSNTASKAAFRKRFFSWFNMFKVVKYLNWSHTENIFNKVPVAEAAGKLLELVEKTGDYNNSRGLLYRYRRLED